MPRNESDLALSILTSIPQLRSTIEDWLRELMESRTLASKSVRSIGSLLRLVFRQAVKWGYLPHSPMDYGDVPAGSTMRQKEPRALTPAARQKAKGFDYLFSASTGQPLDMNVFRKRKMAVLLKSLEIPQAGFHAFRHFNVALLDALRVPLKTIQERIGHAITGSFTLDVYGGTPEWGRNLEAARLVGAELEKAVKEAEEAQKTETAVRLNCALTAPNEKGSGAAIS